MRVLPGTFADVVAPGRNDLRDHPHGLRIQVQSVYEDCVSRYNLFTWIAYPGTIGLRGLRILVQSVYVDNCNPKVIAVLHIVAQ